MNTYGSQHALNAGQRVGSRSDVTGGGTYYSRSDVATGGGGNGHAFGEGFRSKTFTRTVKGGTRRTNTLGGSSMSGTSYAMNISNRAKQQQGLCQEYLFKAEQSLQAGSGDSEYFMGLARDALEGIKTCAIEMGQLGLSNESVLRSADLFNMQLSELYNAMSNTMGRRKSTKKSSGSTEDEGRRRMLMNDALAWIAAQKSFIETFIWADEPSTIQEQLITHQRFHSNIHGALEVTRALEEMKRSNEKANQHHLEQEWENLKKMSNLRTDQLRELMEIVNDICNEIMWVNDKEEQELMFDWGDKNIDEYIPKKQESYSRLMKDLEEKEKELHKLGARSKALLKNNHPAADKIEAYMDTLQTQWSWLLQITKCIDTHLKENAAYSQFIKETNATMKALHEDHELIRKSFVCNKNTSLDDLKELLKGLEREKQKLMDHKREVQHLTTKSKSIVRLKPRNPEEKGSNGILVRALTDFKQDQKVILKGNEAILKDNSQRSKWKVVGPGGLDMSIPSVCLIIPPPNPLCVSLATKNEQYYEAIMSIWHQLYINVKSLIAWQYCLMDIKYINSLTISMLSKMRPEEYRQILKKLEAHYEEFKINSHESEVIVDEDKRNMEDQVNGAQSYYNKLVVELPTQSSHQEQTEVQQIPEQQVQQHMYIIQQRPQQHHQILLLQQDPKQQQLLLLQQQQQEQQRLLLLQQQEQEQQQLLLLQQQQEQEKERQQAAAEEEARRLEEERRQAELKKQAKKEMAEKEHAIKKEVVKVTKTEIKRKVSSSSSSTLSSSHLLSELHALRLRMDDAEGLLSQYVHICFGEDGAQDCGLKITQIETVQDDIESIRDEYLRIRERILKELENMRDVDKAQFLRSEIGVINQRLGTLESSSSAYVLRLRALRDMLESIARAEDIVKVHEARLTEKETTSLSPAEVSEYMETLKNMRAELVQKRDVLTSMESELSKANHWNSQMGGSYHRCDLMLSKFSEQVGLLSDRWRRIQAQIDTRLQDLQQYLPQLQHYKQTSTSIIEWIDATRRKQDALQATKIESVQTLNDHINNQKALNIEIKSKRETVESVLRDNEACVNTIKDYETDLNSYSSGLETLLSVPIKRTMLKSPSMDLNQEAIHLQTRYMELFTLSGDYYKFLGELLKNMEQLKIRNTRIDLLEEELRRLKDEMQERNDQNKSLEEAVAQFKLQLSHSQEQLLSLEEVKQTTALQCSATKDSLDSTQSQLTDLKNEVERLRYLLDEEKRKTKLAEERYTQQQEEYDSVLRKRQKELETVSWSKVEVEKSLTNKEHELEQLRQQLAEESARFMELQKEMSKTRITTQSLQSKYNEIVSERDSLLQKLQRLELDKEQMQRLEEELNRLKLSHESELRNKQRLQEESERVKRDLSYWKDQCDGKQNLIRQYDTDKDILVREKKSLKDEIEKLMKELRELEEKYKSRLVLLQKQMQDMTVVRQTMETELKQAREPPTPDTASVVFQGVRKPVTAKQLLECGILDTPTYNQLVKGHTTIPAVSSEKKVPLKGTGPIAGVIIESPKCPGSNKKPICKLTFTEAKKENLLPPDSIDLLLDAQAATGHIIDPRTNQKLTVEEAYNQGVVDEEDRERLLSAEAAAVGYSGPGANKPLSVFQAMKKGLIDKNTTLRLLQAQESVGGILDPVLSVFLPRDTATERDLINDDMCYALNQRPELYLDPETEKGVTYMAMKRRCKVEPHTGLLLLPIPEKVDPSNLVFDGVRKPVNAKDLFDCGVLDKQTFKDLENGRKTVPEVSVDKTINLKGTGPIAGVIVSSRRKMSLTEAKKQMLLPDECADLLLEAQAATGHIIDPKANKKLTVEEAFAKGLVDSNDLDRLLASEAAAVGYKDPSTPKPISVFQAMKKGLIDNENGLRLLQAQESVGGILDPILSVFLPRDTAIKRKLLDENLCQALNQSPECYIDPETEQQISYQALKESCKIEPHTGLLLLPVNEKLDPSKLIFDGVRKPVTAKQLFDCGVLDKPTYNKLIKGDKTVPEVSLDKKIFLKGTGSIAGVTVGSLGKMSLSQAKTQMLIPPESADLLLEAQAATGHVIDPMSNQKLTVEEACARRVVDSCDRDRLLAAEAAAVGYKDPHTSQPISVFEAIKKGLIDKKTGVRLLQAQESAGGILDPNLSVFLPKDTAIKRNLLDQDLCRVLSQNPQCYLDPDTERDASYGALKKKCKSEPHTGLALLPLADRKDPSKLIFDGVRKPVSAQQLLDCGVLDKPTFNKLIRGEKTVPEVSVDKKIFLKGTGSIAGVTVGSLGKMSLSNAKKQMLIPSESADLLLEAQAATGHIIDPMANQKLTVEEACARRVVDTCDQDKLLTAEAAAVGYKDPYTGQSLSVFEAIKKGIIDKKTGVRLLQAQESAGGILDPILSVFLPKDTAIKRNLLDEDLYRSLSQNPECYLDPDTERDASYGAIKKKCKTEPQTGLSLLPLADRKDPSKLIFDGVRKPVSAQELLDCGVLDKPTFNKLIKGEKTVPEVSVDKKIFLKGTGSIAGVTVGSLGKMSLSDAKKKMLLSAASAYLLLEAQAATGHIIDPMSNQKLTVEEACARGVVDKSDGDKLLAAEAAAVGYKDPHTGQSLSVFQAVKKGLIDKKTGVRLLQAQESAGGILDPNLSVFLPKETALKRNLLDEDLYRALNQNPNCYLDPDTERDASYETLKKKCKNEPQTGLALLPLADRKDPSKLIFDGVRKPVSAQQLLDCGVLDKPTFNKLIKGEKTVAEVSVDKKVFLKGTGPIAGVTGGSQGKMSLSNAKKQMLMPPESADLLLEAQAATGNIIDPISNQKLTVDEACARGVVDKSDREKLLAAEAAAIGYSDPNTGQSLSVFEAIKKRLIDKKTGIRLLQAQESAGGILEPNLSVFLPKETALKRKLLDEDLLRALNQNPNCYLDPDTEHDISYGSLKRRCKIEPHTGLVLLPFTERNDPSKLIFDGVRKPVSAQQLLECGVIDQATFNKLIKGEKTVSEVSVDKKVYLKGTGPIGGVLAGRQGKISFSEAKKQKIISEDSADLLLEAQAATGHIIDPKTEQKFPVEVACIKGLVDFKDQKRLLAAESAAVGYKDPSSGKVISLFEAMKKGIIDEKTGLRLLQAQDSVGGILDPNLSVFLPKDTAIKRNLLDEKLINALKQNPACYLNPETEHNASYGALKVKCNINTHTGLHIFPVSEKCDPSKLLFDGVHKTVTAQQLLDCGVLDKETFDQLMKGKKTVSEVSGDIKIFLKGTGPIAGVAAEPVGKMSFTEAKKQKIMSSDSANMLLLAQAATGHIIDPGTNKKLTVKEALARGLVVKEDESMLFAAEAAATGYRDPDTAKVLSAGQAMRKGIIDKDTALPLLQAQESVGGILDPSLSVFLPKDIARKRDIIDEDLHQALNQSPECYLDPDTQQPTPYISLKKKCKTDPSTGLLLLPKPKQSLTIRGLRNEVSVIDLVKADLLNKSDVDKLNTGKLTSQDIEDRLRSYLGGSTCIAGVYDEASDKVMSIYQAMVNKLLRRGTTLELLEAQAASGFMIDPINNLFLTVAEAYNRGLFGPEFKEKLLSAEKAVTGYKMPGTDKIISLFQAIENNLVEKGHGIRLLEAQIASGGIIDPQHSHRIDVNVAYKRGYFNEEMNKILTDESDDTKGFFDPNTEENLTYLELKKRCILDKNTGLVLLPITDKKKQESSQKNTVRKRRVIIVDPETGKEMTIREAYNKGFIDHDTYLELSEQECEWEEITITAPDGSIRLVIIDRSTGRQFDINDLLENQIIDQSILEQYRSHAITLTQFADIISNKTAHDSTSLPSSNLIPEHSAKSSVTSSSITSTSASLNSSSGTLSTSRISEDSTPASFQSSFSSSSSSTGVSRPLSPAFTKTTTTKTTTIIERGFSSSTVAEDLSDSQKRLSSVSITLSPPLQAVGEVEPVGAIFDTETLGKISVTEALNRGLVDSITAQRLLEAQACTGGIVNPINGKRISIQEASRIGIIANDMVTKLKPAQKAYFGFEDIKLNRKLSAAQAMKEMWLPYEAGQRFLEFQVATGGLYDPENGCRRSIEDALKMGWLDVRAAQKLQDIKHHTKILTCPKSKLRISYKEALDNCLVEDGTGVKMLQASSVSSRGISSPYNVASAPGSKTGSRSGSQRGSRRSSLDLGSSLTPHIFSSFTSFSSTK